MAEDTKLIKFRKALDQLLLVVIFAVIFAIMVFPPEYAKALAVPLFCFAGRFWLEMAKPFPFETNREHTKVAISGATIVMSLGTLYSGYVYGSALLDAPG